jgi:hypothetical protein
MFTIRIFTFSIVSMLSHGTVNIDFMHQIYVCSAGSQFLVIANGTAKFTVMPSRMEELLRMLTLAS